MSFRFKSTCHNDHQAIFIEGGDGQKFCGQSWCDGACGLPALIIYHEYDSCGVPRRVQLKAHGSMVACGPVWQQFRTKWTGQLKELETDIPVEKLLKMMWW